MSIKKRNEQNIGLIITRQQKSQTVIPIPRILKGPLRICISLFWVLVTVSCTNFTQTNSTIDASQSLNRVNKSGLETVQFKYGAADIMTDAILDSKGNLWFTSTNEGIFRYDGLHFTNFTENDGLCNNKVWSVLEDSNGIIWFGTNDGLCKFDGETFLHIPLPNEKRIHPNDNPDKPISSTNSIASIMQDFNGNIWIGTGGNGAYRYDGSKFTNYLSDQGWKQPDSLHFNIIQSIVQDNSGDIWFTSMTHGGVSRYDGKGFTHFTKKDGLPDDMIFSSFKDSYGNLWFGTLDKGLIVFQEGSFRYYDETDGLSNNMVSSFYQDKSGRIWIGSFRESTVTWYDGNAFSSVPFDHNQNLVELRFILEDKFGNIWFGGRYGILWSYDGKQLSDFTHSKRL